VREQRAIQTQALDAEERAVLAESPIKRERAEESETSDPQ